MVTALDAVGTLFRWPLVIAFLIAWGGGESAALGQTASHRLWVLNGGFEAGAEVGWGQGPSAENRAWWWNSRDCQSVAEISGEERHSGKLALHIVNISARAPHVYGTTQQPPVAIQPGRRYRVSLWAKAPQIASPGAVSLVVDSAWKVRPIQLPSGGFDWTQFSGEFVLHEPTAQIRILCEDLAEVWIDEVALTPADLPPPQ